MKKAKPLPVKLIVGLITSNGYLFKETEKFLCNKFGAVDFESEILPFRHTDYYEREFGKDLKRKFLSFNKLITPESLPKIKQFTRRLENKFLKRNCRQINIDPGYLSDSKLILATMKDYCHRLYLNNRIYGEVTLYYQKGSFRPWPWTYPDYQSSEYIEIFNRIRKIYRGQLPKRTNNQGE